MSKHVHTEGLNPRWLERVIKGFANQRRIRVLMLLSNEPELPLCDICKRIKMSRTAGSDHVRKLVLSGLVVQRQQKRYVHHKVTDRGLRVLAFLKTLN